VCENAKSLGVRMIANFHVFSVESRVFLVFLDLYVVVWAVYRTFIDFYCGHFEGKGD
jgi:hypothetical protein